VVPLVKSFFRLRREGGTLPIRLQLRTLIGVQLKYVRANA
jgi:hypothetical protein